MESKCTIVFDRAAESYEKNPLHMQSDFGNVVAVCRGDALEKKDAYHDALIKAREVIEFYSCQGLTEGESELRWSSDCGATASDALTSINSVLGE